MGTFVSLPEHSNFFHIYIIMYNLNICQTISIFDILDEGVVVTCAIIISNVACDDTATIGTALASSAQGNTVGQAWETRDDSQEMNAQGKMQRLRVEGK